MSYPAEQNADSYSYSSFEESDEEVVGEEAGRSYAGIARGPRPVEPDLILNESSNSNEPANDSNSGLGSWQPAANGVQLLVVRSEEFPQIPLATVREVEGNPEWKLQMGNIPVAELADGEAFGEDNDYLVQQDDNIFAQDRAMEFKIIAIPVNSFADLQQEPEEPEVEEVTEREYSTRPKAQSITPEDWQQMKQFTRQQTTRPDEVAEPDTPRSPVENQGQMSNFDFTFDNNFVQQFRPAEDDETRHLLIQDIDDSEDENEEDEKAEEQAPKTSTSSSRICYARGKGSSSQKRGHSGSRDEKSDSSSAKKFRYF